MANSLSSKKRVRQNAKRRARNRWRMSTLRAAVKEFMDKLAHGSAADAKANFKKLSRLIDRTASIGVIHKNAAARRKSRLNKRLKAKVTAKA